MWRLYGLFGKHVSRLCRESEQRPSADSQRWSRLLARLSSTCIGLHAPLAWCSTSSSIYLVTRTPSSRTSQPSWANCRRLPRSTSADLMSRPSSRPQPGMRSRRGGTSRMRPMRQGPALRWCRAGPRISLPRPVRPSERYLFGRRWPREEWPFPGKLTRCNDETSCSNVYDVPLSGSVLGSGERRSLVLPSYNVQRMTIGRQW